jgi:DNA-binding HxlR family transcriptional regulator
MIDTNNGTLCVDPSIPILKVIGKKYTLLIMGLLGNREGVKNFHYILMSIPYASATAISQRLKELIAAGLVSKEKNGQRNVYLLTEYGKRIRALLIPLIREIGTEKD